jgi:DNA repair protein RadA/Sms
MGQCPSCSEWGTMVEELAKPKLASKMPSSQAIVVKNLNEVEKMSVRRTSTGLTEFDRVLGGHENEQGYVDGEVILLSGEPGVGKSTILLQVIYNLSKAGENVLYVSAEESIDQLYIRAERLFKEKLDQTKIAAVSTGDIDAILATISEQKAKFVVIDSIQTIYTPELRSLPGGAAQVKECSSRITTFAKQNNVTVIIVGHVTKEGIVAGPKLLEHLVDCVVSLEGERSTGFRILRTGKNRFGSTNEVGVFEMTDGGLTDLIDVSKVFLSEHAEGSVGVCTSAILEGNRILIVEVQALTNTTPFSLPKRVAEGVSTSKLQLLCAILSKHARLDLSDKDVYVNVAGGLKVREPAIELAICLAIASSVKNKPLPSKTIAFGEVSLTGDLRKVSRIDDRIKEAKKIGYKKIVSASDLPHISRLQNILGK